MSEKKDQDKAVKKVLDLRNKGKREAGLSDFVFGKLPPQAPALEEAVLGAIMLDKDALTVVIDTLRPDSFYSDAHALIYKAMLSLFERTQPIDLLTVSEELKKTGDLEKVGGPYYLVELTNRVASSANLEYHARIVAQKFIQRELIRVSNTVIKDAYEDTTDVFELLDKAEQGLFEITEKNLSRSYSSMSSLLGQAVKQVEEASHNKEGLTGVPTGFVDLDRMTSGWQPSDLVIVAARPGMGKTAFTLALAANAATFQKPVAFFSLEMSSIQLVKRLISMETEIPGEKLKKGSLEDYEWQQLNAAVEKMGERKIFIDDTPAINIFELRAKCRRLKMQHDIQMVMIDYLQLMSGSMDKNKSTNREQEISSISRALKGLAKELSVPVIALSQLSRAVETRGGTKRPQLSDLRESGAIEQDADMVTFIYRPEYYQILEDEEGNSLKNKAEVIIAKHRNGALGTVELRFTGETAKFSDWGDAGFGDFSPAPGNTDSPMSNIITRSSKMNEDFDDVPF